MEEGEFLKMMTPGAVKKQIKLRKSPFCKQHLIGWTAIHFQEQAAVLKNDQ